jgi:hypothetical protein
MAERFRVLHRVLALAASVLLHGSGSAAAQVDTRSSVLSVPGEQTMELEEVEVIGKKLHQLQSELIETQDRFYALYNKLNTNDDFDIHCTMHAPIGTRIEKRQCRLEFLREATAAEGQNFFLGRGATAGISPQTLWFTREDEYRKTNPELMELAEEWQRRQTRYENARKERLQGRLVLFE